MIRLYNKSKYFVPRNRIYIYNEYVNYIYKFDKFIKFHFLFIYLRAPGNE